MFVLLRQKKRGGVNNLERLERGSVSEGCFRKCEWSSHLFIQHLFINSLLFQALLRCLGYRSEQTDNSPCTYKLRSSGGGVKISKISGKLEGSMCYGCLEENCIFTHGGLGRVGSLQGSKETSYVAIWKKQSRQREQPMQTSQDGSMAGLLEEEYVSQCMQ